MYLLLIYSAILTKNIAMQSLPSIFTDSIKVENDTSFIGTTKNKFYNILYKQLGLS